MMLSDQDIERELSAGRLAIDPYEPQLLQPASVDLRLHRHFLLHRTLTAGFIDPAVDQDNYWQPITVESDGVFSLNPDDFVLATTYEHVTLDARHAARVEGKSSLGRLGLLVHATAGFVDPGFFGHITLELANLTGNSILLYPGMAIAQLSVHRLSSPARRPYGRGAHGSRYNNQPGYPVPSRLHHNFKIWGLSPADVDRMMQQPPDAP